MSNIFVGLSVKSSINQPLKNSSLFRHSQCAHRLILTGTDKSGYQEFLIQGVIKEASNAGVNTISSAGISLSPKQSNNSGGIVRFASVKGDIPPRLCLGELLMWLIIRVMSS